MTRLALLLGMCSLLSVPLQAAEQGCPIYGLEPPIPLFEPPALLPDGFALISHFGDLIHNPSAAVLRFDADGRLLWARRLSGERGLLDWSSGTGDGTLLTAGGARTSDGLGPVVAKLRPDDGTIVWSKLIRGATASVWGFAGSVDGGGYAAMFGVAKARIGLVLRLTRDGEIAWARSLSVGGDAVIQPVVASQTDGVLIGKTWQVGFDEPSAILLLKLTQGGELDWARLISHTTRGLGISSILVQPDDSFVVVGSAQGDGADGSDSALVHLDRTGHVLSGTALHAPPLGSLRLISSGGDGGFLLAGTTARGGPALADPVDPSQPTIARLTADGHVSWAKAENFGPGGGMLFGLLRGTDHLVVTGVRGDWGPSTLMRLTLDGDPSGDSWNGATLVRLGLQKIDLTSASIKVGLEPIRLEAINAGLSASEVTVKLVPLCPR